MLLLLERHASRPAPDIFPQDVTQDGMAESLGVSRGHLVKVLNKLIDLGLVACSQQRVAGRTKMVYAYFLTAAGVEEARHLQAKMIGHFPLPFTADGGPLSRGVGGVPGQDETGSDLRRPGFRGR